MLRSYPRTRSGRNASAPDTTNDKWDRNSLILYSVICVFVVGCFVVRPGVVWSTVASTSQAEPERVLYQVHVVFRHGARTPLWFTYYNNTRWSSCSKHYKGVNVHLRDINGGPITFNDQDRERLAGGCIEGQLLQRGYQMALEVGNELRKRYMDGSQLLPRSYQEGALWLWTTRFHRSFHTLRGVLTGLYPSAGLRANFTAHSVAEEHEIMYGKPRNCPALEEQFNELERQMFDALAADVKLIGQASRVSEKLALPTAPKVEWTFLFDMLAALKAVGRAPRQLDKETWDTISKAASWAERVVLAPCDANLRTPNGTCRQVVQRSVGRLIDGILTAARSAAAPTCSRQRTANCTARMFLYSGHDATLTPLMAALGLRGTVWPPFAAHMSIEVWGPRGAAPGSMDNMHVRVLYGFDPKADSEPNEGFVPWTKFLAQIQQYSLTAEEYKSSCHLQSRDQQAEAVQESEAVEQSKESGQKQKGKKQPRAVEKRAGAEQAESEGEQKPEEAAQQVEATQQVEGTNKARGQGAEDGARAGQSAKGQTGNGTEAESMEGDEQSKEQQTGKGLRRHR